MADGADEREELPGAEEPFSLLRDDVEVQARQAGSRLRHQADDLGDEAVVLGCRGSPQRVEQAEDQLGLSLPPRDACHTALITTSRSS